jgi:anthranilate phosphoribosyltransferase
MQQTIALTKVEVPGISLDEILSLVRAQQNLSESDAEQMIYHLASEDLDQEKAASLLQLLSLRAPSLEELLGYQSAMIKLARPIDLGKRVSIDLCGTGGDGKNTYNISTAVAFLLAAAGYPVSKHGNYGVSSLCGSSNVLEYLGYQFPRNEEEVLEQLDRFNLVFIHAPYFHPAMKFVAPVRKRLGIRTLFNLLGPLVNPARPVYQYVGVSNLEIARLYQYFFQKQGREYVMVHGLDGYDEMTLSDKTRVVSRSRVRDILPVDLRLPQVKPENLNAGNSIEEAARMLVDVLENRANPDAVQVLIANAAMAASLFEADKSFGELYEQLNKVHRDAKAIELLKRVCRN